MVIILKSRKEFNLFPVSIGFSFLFSSFSGNAVSMEKGRFVVIVPDFSARFARNVWKKSG